MHTPVARLAPIGLALTAALFGATPLTAQADTSLAMAHDDTPAISTNPHGSFTRLNDHRASGGFEIITANGKQELRLHTDFALDQAPDVYVVLSNSTTIDGKSLYLGRLRKLSGTSTFTIPTGTALTSFGQVVLWCKRFKVAGTERFIQLTVQSRSPER